MARTFFRSFGAGEITPELFARYDIPESQSGAALVRNFMPTPSGAVRRRPGFEYVSAHPAGTAVRLIPFTFGRGESLVLELGVLDTPAGVLGSRPSYLRVLTNGAPSRRTAFPAAWSAGSYNMGTVVSHGGNVYYATESLTSGTPGTTDAWYQLPDPWIHEIPTLWTAEQIAELRYAQSNDVVTFTSIDIEPQDFSRYLTGASVVEFRSLASTFSTNAIATPTGLAVVGTAGNAMTPYESWLGGPGDQRLRFKGGHSLLDNDTVVLPTNLVCGALTWAAGTYTVIRVDSKDIVLRTRSTGAPYNPTGSGSSALWTSGKIYLQNDPIGEATSYYKVTALTAEGMESLGSTTASVTNNLYVNGAYNSLTWSSVSNAARYRVYKRRNGVYAYIGETETPSFVDDNIAPDFSFTPPRADAVTTSTWRPLAVGYFEQRRVFANDASFSSPRDVWMSRPGSITDFTYHLPTVADDRISFRLAAKDYCYIQHVVALDQLILLTDSTEFRVTADGALSGTNLVVRPQSYVGCSRVTPLVKNNQILFAGQRGGHLHTLVYSDTANGFATGDLCLRAAHLFDGYTLTDMTLQNAPRSIVWATNDQGHLLSASYLPGEQVLGWARHTGASFRSVCCIPEGTEDRLYVIAERNGATQVERMATDLVPDRADEMVYLDGSERVEYPGSGNCTISAAHGWAAQATVTLTFASSQTLSPGEEVEFGKSFRCRVTVGGPTGTVFTARVLGTVPAAYRGTARTDWRICRKSHTVAAPVDSSAEVWADGVKDTGAVISGGTVTTTSAAAVVLVGYPYTSTLKTMPLALQIEGLAQGKTKSLTRAWMRTQEGTSALVAGPSGSATSVALTEGGMTELAMITSGWDIDGAVEVTCSVNAPLTVVGLALELAVGG